MAKISGNRLTMQENNDIFMPQGKNEMGNGAQNNCNRSQNQEVVMATIKEISAITGVSKSTISRVINNDVNVSEKTRQLVLDAIQENNYTPNIIARSMITGKFPMVLIIVGDIENYYFARTVVGIEKILSDTEYMPVIYNSMYDEKKERALLNMAKQFRFAGIIPMTSTGSKQLTETCNDIDMTMVF